MRSSIQKESQRYSHQSNGGAERMVQTTRNQIKAYKIKIKKNAGISVKFDSPLLPILLVGEAVPCRRPGALVNKYESAWLEDVWFGRGSKTDEHLIATSYGMVRSRALKRRVERRRWDVTLLNAMIWDPWFGIHRNRHQSREEDH